MKQLLSMSRLIIALALFVLASCSKNTQELILPNSTQSSPRAVTNILKEGFETNAKGSYTVGTITLPSGSWTMSDALIGNLSGDKKNGSYSVRIRNSGSIYTNFTTTVTAGSTVSFYIATYGTDANGTVAFMVSGDNGATYTQVGNIITTSQALTPVLFTIANAGSYRFQIIKKDGTTNRINVDDFTVVAGTTTGGGTGGSTNDNSNTLLGNPSNATADIANANNYYMDQTYYSISYNNSQGKPNWVSWHVSSTDLGTTPRQDNFREDVKLPASFYHVQATSYSGSGFDRGHNCPSADRTAAISSNSSTFLMTNMMPQSPNNNQVTWANLENYTRTLVTSGNEVFIISGSYGSGGTGSAGIKYTIDNGRITVPSSCWKIIVVIPNGNNDLSRITSTTRVIAINTPNNQILSSDWKTYRVSVQSIQNATGYSFFSTLPADIRNALLTKVDNL